MGHLCIAVRVIVRAAKWRTNIIKIMSNAFIEEMKTEEHQIDIHEEFSQYPISKRYGNMKLFGRDKEGSPRFMLGPHCTSPATQIPSSLPHTASVSSSLHCSFTTTSPSFPSFGELSWCSHAGLSFAAT